MIRHIRGIVLDVSGGNNIVIDVCGVGYLVHVAVDAGSFALEQEIKLHTYMSVQERAQDLYGFTTRDELEIFTALLTLPKIGPKSAMQIMQKTDVHLLKNSILNNDSDHLSKMSGIGKKTSEKIVSGLKEKFKNAGFMKSEKSNVLHTPSYSVDAIEALIILGYSQSDAREAIQQLPSTVQNANDAIKSALKSLGKK